MARTRDGVDLPVLRTDSDIGTTDGTAAGVDEVPHPATGVVESTEAVPGEMAALRERLDDLSSYIEGRRSDWEAMRAGIAARDAELAAAAADSAALREAATGLQERLAAADSAGEKLRKEMADLRRELREQVARRRRAEAEIRDFVSGERTAKDATIAEQAGQLATARQELAGLGQRLRQSELNADEMRRVIDQLREDIGPSHSRASVLQNALSDERERAAGLAGRLDAATVEIESLTRENERLKDEFERETRQIRLELDAAQDTIAGHETLSEQLASDLIDNRSFREALEQQLAATEEEHTERVRKLERRAQTLEQDLADRDRKIEKKDAAISALLAELSSRVRSGESLNELDQAIGEMDDRISSVEESRDVGDKDRPTRVLIGTVSGQELRFPLFKTRLTVGRTAQNDIQLPAAFISRRHAVILTDRDGTRIVDWGSKNGVYVNGARISEQPLHNGDRVRIGTAEFLFEERQRR